MNLRMQPGDSIVVPEKIVGGSEIWKNVIGAAQVMSSIAITGAVTGIF
jgi:ribosomal protein L18E